MSDRFEELEKSVKFNEIRTLLSEQWGVKKKAINSEILYELTGSDVWNRLIQSVVDYEKKAVEDDELEKAIERHEERQHNIFLQKGWVA